MAAKLLEVGVDMDTNSPSIIEAQDGNYAERSTSAQTDSCFPDPHLFTKEGRKDYNRYGIPLYRAAMNGVIETVRSIVSTYPWAVRQSITEGMETVLHVATVAKQIALVKKLVTEWMQPVDLKLENKDGNTALCFAAISGIVPLAIVMIKLETSLPKIRNKAGVTPLHLAALLGHREMVQYLYQCTDDDLTDPERHGIFIICIRNGLYDVAFNMQEKYPQLATTRGSFNETALHVLAQKPALFVDENPIGMWRRIIVNFSGFAHHSSKLSQALRLVDSVWKKVLQLEHEMMWCLIEHPSILTLDAAEAGNVEFLIQLINSYPDLIWRVNKDNRSIFHVAILYRHESIFSLIYGIGSIKDLIATYEDENKNNMLHLVAKLPLQGRLNHVSGAALQMQRELLWFKEVEKVVQPSCKEMRNAEGFTPWDLFVKEHEDLKRRGEDWMRRTSHSMLMVATLLFIVVFVAILTLPGSLQNDAANPIILQKISFKIFIISDAMALFSSASSILMFLSILTSRFAKDDFVKRLPCMLLLGLGTLFVSIGMMVAAFTATIFLIYHHGAIWIPTLISIFVSGPVVLFASLNFPLSVDLWNSTYGSRSLFCGRKHDKLF
ncbi:protein of unknown function DUF3447 - like 10 [Theobroma cacao]|nr:protein of unknown function DUF3447 - like 10 [Theobroma cacao]